jgi:hypothetical protein
MSAARPTTSPELVAAMIESTPDRVRRRLDQNPDAAAVWQWQSTEIGWSIGAGGETVSLPHGHISRADQIACTCLLSPGCFHVLACLTRLQPAIVEPARGDEARQDEPLSADSEGDVVEPDDGQRNAARELVGRLTDLLRIGVANAGIVVQSGLLRAVHQCRADGLHRLAALGLRVITGIGEFRARAPAADPVQLAEDMCDALETAILIVARKAIDGYWFGTARRKQVSVRPRRLHGLFAEPITTTSGFTGAVVYFLGEDERLYTASDVRPGDPQRIRDAYFGGIEFGSLVQPAKQLARSVYLGTDLTSSADGRLGRGKTVKVVEQGRSTWEVASVQSRFRPGLREQWEAIYARNALPADARAAGWDFVFLEGTVKGALGPELLFEPSPAAQFIRLAIENDSKALCYRENLRMLGHAPGLRLRVVGRMNLQEPRQMSPLAVAPVDNGERADGARLRLPESFAGRVCLGFDEVQRHFLVNARPSIMVLGEETTPPDAANALSSLLRRWIAAMLSGLVAQHGGNAGMLAAETAALKRGGFATGAALLDALASVPSSGGPSRVDTFLATGVYLRTCGSELAKSKAMSEG